MFHKFEISVVIFPSTFYSSFTNSLAISITRLKAKGLDVSLCTQNGELKGNDILWFTKIELCFIYQCLGTKLHNSYTCLHVAKITTAATKIPQNHERPKLIYFFIDYFNEVSRSYLLAKQAMNCYYNIISIAFIWIMNNKIRINKSVCSVISCLFIRNLIWVAIHKMFTLTSFSLKNT